jgi:ribonuclease HI
MELRAVIAALREVHAPWSPMPLSEFRKIGVLTDSDYLVSGYQSALFRWPRDRWMTSAGSPVENADLWQELVKAVQRTGKRVEFTWTPGKKDTHAKAMDKLAKRSALGHLNGPLTPTRVRRSRSPQQVSRGSVPIGGQSMRIYIRTDKWMPVQRCFRYRYEVCDDGPLEGLVDDMYSDRSIMLSAGHEYLLRVNDDPGHPQVVEVIEEITAPVADDQSG